MQLCQITSDQWVSLAEPAETDSGLTLPSGTKIQIIHRSTCGLYTVSDAETGNVHNVNKYVAVKQ